MALEKFVAIHQLNQANSSLSASFSMYSLAEGSEVISEAEEINEVRALQKKGDRALSAKNYADAIRLYTEALEIDEVNGAVLKARATSYLAMKEYDLAFKDAEMLIGLQNEQPQAHYLHGVTLDYLGKSKDAIMAFLNSLDLDQENASLLSNHIASLTGSLCDIPEKKLLKLKDTDPYKKLCEVGAFLYNSKRYEICIRVLKVAQKVETNQKGITMKVLLTLANAHSALKHNEEAIMLYQDCLKVAVATHDGQYQTKALVNIASLFLELNDTHKSIVYYERLLDLEAEFLVNEGCLPPFWTRELECGLRLNLSLAYKSIGNLRQALVHAQKYLALLEKYDMKEKLRAESQHNIGMLNEILEQYDDAVNNYKAYLNLCKKTGNKKGMAQAYGCLGSVYTVLKNWSLAISYLDQQIAIAKKLEDKRLQRCGLEQLGDTYMKKDDCEKALSQYFELLKQSTKVDIRMQCSALCKIGGTYQQQKRFQYSLYYFDEAASLAQERELEDIQIMAEFKLACVLQTSTQMMELEQARKYFEKLIPILETKIQMHRDEDTYCASELYEELMLCYDGIQSVLSKLGNKEQALEFAESYRRYRLLHEKSHSAIVGRSVTSSHGLSESWTVDRIKRVVMQQNATILYYSILHDLLLLWVLQPDKGLVRFYSTRMLPRQTTSQHIATLLQDLTKEFNYRELQAGCENRALPLPDVHLTVAQDKNERLSVQHKRDALKKQFEAENPEEPSPKEQVMNSKPAERKLFDLLLAPVEDILCEVEEGHVIVVPDKELYDCPFHLLKDWNNKFMKDRFRITYLPSFYMIEKAFLNELDQLKADDDLEFSRSQAKYGGLQKELLGPIKKNIMSVQDSESSVTSNDGSVIGAVNPKHTSYPRIVHIVPKPSPAAQSATPAEKLVKKKQQRQNTLVPIPQPSTNKMVSKILSGGPKTPRTPNSKLPTDCPTNMPQILGMHTLTTMTTCTSTGTDVVSSTGTVTEFKQISDHDRFVVIGNPALPERLQLRNTLWRPPGGLEAERKEIQRIASYIEVEPIMGADATKDRFLHEFATASVLHIATYGCAHDGSLVMSPNVTYQESGPPPGGAYLISNEEIRSACTMAKLVIISSGWSTYQRKYEERQLLLPSAFVLAGAQCVLYLMWPITDRVLEKFYYHFYETLQKGSLVTEAVRAAMGELAGTEGYNKLHQWAPFILVGKDVNVNLNHIKHAMMDQTIDDAESDVIRLLNKNPLNPVPAIPNVPGRDENMHSLQVMFMKLLSAHKQQPEVLQCLVDMLDSGLKRLHTEDSKVTTELDDKIAESPAALELLKFLGFHFQPKGPYISHPYVVYPHWNIDELLVPAYDALRALSDVAEDESSKRAFLEFFPTTQDNISYMIDMIAITKHAQEIQLKVSDLSVKSLWSQPKANTLLKAFGFKQIGMLLNFNRIPANRKLLNGLLQFLLSVSSYKSTVLMHKLDVNHLGTRLTNAPVNVGNARIPTLAPLMLPRNKVYISKPWMSQYESTNEMDEKISLAKQRHSLDADFNSHATRVKTWQQNTLLGQAQESLDKFGEVSQRPLKVKVIPGETTSHPTKLVDEKPVLSIWQTDDRRDYAHYVLLQRLENVGLRQKDETQKMYLPYIPNK
ncbi:tetratricopeptide repeat protein 28-like [Lineus longissimus]|uniref:tetratricopeptide repeat protein 28-like n=1 Tax=Lineus longissimus TaxID=88925 RepID=UPI002B4E8629